jgi:hypothetical protein
MNDTVEKSRWRGLGEPAVRAEMFGCGLSNTGWLGEA